MKRYVLEPVEISDRCFLLHALYWLAFKIYPIREIDILADNISSLIDDMDMDIDDPTGPFDFSVYDCMYTPEFCQAHNLPTDPDTEAFLAGKETYLSNDYYEELLKDETLSEKVKKKLKREQKEAFEFNKRKEDFKEKTDNFHLFQ